MKNFRTNLALGVVCLCLAGLFYTFQAYARRAGPKMAEIAPGQPGSFLESQEKINKGGEDKQKEHKPKNACKDKDPDEREDKEDRDEDCDCYEASPRVLAAGPAGVSLGSPTFLLSAISIINSGKATKKNVQVSSLRLAGGNLTMPATLPVNLGTIQRHGTAVLNADFSGGLFHPREVYGLTADGTYSRGKKTYCFKLHFRLEVPPETPGSATVSTVKVAPHKVSGAHFPPQPPRFGERVNRPRPPVPVAPYVPGTPTPTSTATQPAVIGDPPAIVFNTTNSVGITNGSTIAEPSGDHVGNVVFMTANWFAAYSGNGGGAFTRLNPTTVFPNDAVGYCCDQIVQYAPSVDRFFWLLQGNGYRLASASPADIINSGGTAWTYWNLTPDIFGQPANSFDFPDLSVGTNYLYILGWTASWWAPLRLITRIRRMEPLPGART